MSVTFFDPENHPVYDQDYNQVDGGEEVNFSNSNTYMVLRIMGIKVNAGDLFGEMDGEMFRKRVLIGLATVSSDAFHDQDEYDLERRLNLLWRAFKNAKTVSWG